LYSDISQYEKAEEFFEKALEIYQEFALAASEWEIQVAQVRYNQCFLYWDWGKPQMAFSMLDVAEELLKSHLSNPQGQYVMSAVQRVKSSFDHQKFVKNTAFGFQEKPNTQNQATQPTHSPEAEAFFKAQNYEECIRIWEKMPFSQNEDADYYAQSLLHRGQNTSAQSPKTEEKALNDFKKAAEITEFLLSQEAEESMQLLYLQILYAQMQEYAKNFVGFRNQFMYQIGERNAEKFAIQALFRKAKAIPQNEETRPLIEKIQKEFGKY
jgi:tetratricopeptide (TPR) repeat protein